MIPSKKACNVCGGGNDQCPLHSFKIDVKGHCVSSSTVLIACTKKKGTSEDTYSGCCVQAADHCSTMHSTFRTNIPLGRVAPVSGMSQKRRCTSLSCCTPKPPEGIHKVRRLLRWKHAFGAILCWHKLLAPWYNGITVISLGVRAVEIN